MRKTTMVVIAAVAYLASCASHPNKIDAAYVSPLKYKDYDCDQLAMEMDYVGQRATKLYHQLKKERTADNWQAGVGIFLVWPTLLLLEGGDGSQATEYAQLQGEFEALRTNATQRKCSFDLPSPDEIIKKGIT